jgi:hypothetical protein
MERMESEETVPSFGQTDSGPEYETSSATFPRPMSRASTVHTGKLIGLKNPFDNPPPMPGRKHDSVDMLEESGDGGHGWSGYDPYEQYAREGADTSMSRTSYAQSEARVESVHVGRSAEAGLLQTRGMNERRRREPFEAGGRI